jgi:PAS domain S-box-containing protein
MVASDLPAAAQPLVPPSRDEGSASAVSTNSPAQRANADSNPRILIIDDTRAIHDDFRKVLTRSDSTALEKAEAELFGSRTKGVEQTQFALDSAFQGKEGLELAKRAHSEGRPYALAFVDVRMPPGWDGIETISHLWKVDRDLQVVICTAYSDYSWDDIVQRLGHTDSLLILKKPFDSVEVMQIAHSLTKKWQLAQQSRWRVAYLDARVNQRTQELHAANRELSLQLEQFRSVWERSIDGMRLTDRAGCIVAVNEAYCKLVRLSREQLIGQPFSITYKGHGPTDGMDVYTSRFDSGSFIPRLTARVQLWNSEEVELEISSSFLESPQYGKLALALFRDITERKHLEQQLRQSQKMEAIGQLAGGVAHDFNNLLAVIRGNAELLLMNRDQLKADPGDCLKQVVAAADRAAGLTRQLLTFGRKQAMQSTALNVAEVIGNLTKMLKRIIGEDILLQCTFAARLPMVRADIGMLEQVLVNLVVNARDAMPNGGQLIMNSEAVRLDRGDLQRHPEGRAGEFVCLHVSDTGCGIRPEHLPRIFEPFFTTKEFGKGTGLGLATVYGIVKQHHGWIEVSSRVGTGSSFRVFLPAVEGPAPLAPAEPNEEAQPQGGNETILLVEDDPSVRRLSKRLLESFGYQVHEATSGREALEQWSPRVSEIDLLLTDIVMPYGVDGRKLAELMTAQKPGLKIILTTGYSGDVIGQDTCFLYKGKGRLLQKPCPPREFLHAVRECLDQR